MHVNISGAGVTQYAKHRDAAIKLIEFLSSPEAQNLYADINYEYPANPAVKPSALLTAWGSFKADQVDVAAAGEFQARRRSAGWKWDRVRPGKLGSGEPAVRPRQRADLGDRRPPGRPPTGRARDPWPIAAGAVALLVATPGPPRLRLPRAPERGRLAAPLGDPAPRADREHPRAGRRRRRRRRRARHGARLARDDVPLPGPGLLEWLLSCRSPCRPT